MLASLHMVLDGSGGHLPRESLGGTNYWAVPDGLAKSQCL